MICDCTLNRDVNWKRKVAMNEAYGLYYTALRTHTCDSPAEYYILQLHGLWKGFARDSRWMLLDYYTFTLSYTPAVNKHRAIWVAFIQRQCIFCSFTFWFFIVGKVYEIWFYRMHAT